MNTPPLHTQDSLPLSKKIMKYIFKFFVYLFSAISLALLAITIFRPEWIKAAIEWIGELIKTLGYWNYSLAWFSAFIESLPVIWVLVPGMNIMILVGGFWGKFHFFQTIVCATIWAMLGNYIGYIIGKKYGKYIITQYGDWVGIGLTEQKILERQIQKNGFWYIVLGKFHGTLRAFIPFVAGASNMHEKNFWIYNSIGSIIWAISINLIGIFFVEKYEIILDNFWKISTVILILLGLYMIIFQRETLKQYWNDKNAEILSREQSKSLK